MRFVVVSLGAPVWDLVRLTRVRRWGAGSGEVGLAVVGSAADLAVLTAVPGERGLGVAPGCPVSAFEAGGGPGDVAVAVRAALAGAARVLVVSTVVRRGPRSHRMALSAALDAAAGAGVLVVAAGAVGAVGAACPVLEHPWVVPVFACGPTGRPAWFVEWDAEGVDAGGDEVPRGLLAPGQDVPTAAGRVSGNGVAAVVAGAAAALVWSLAPGVPASVVRSGLSVGAVSARRWGPPVLDVERAWEFVSRGVA
ncbi:hypothetical protein [Actinokineospora bangkokensis]|uniref:Peptidase S8/S53 domain-containing protein n=1 Tax=Actinokineospora bangkokensis TaxID=1193682 RepID=A0A1Q9LP72_9PSEU|nr:hypothetical protein [Actinokineospora bangkokensis]OLR93832.1 hypothetical protein BJP25_16530 [Actinokineospora bangkokensis]